MRILPHVSMQFFHPLTSKMTAKTSFSVLKAQNKALMDTVVLKLADKIALHLFLYEDHRKANWLYVIP